MKDRNPIQRAKHQSQPLADQKEKEFRIESSVIENIEVTSIDKVKIIGKPIIYVSLSSEKIVGTTNSFYKAKIKTDFHPYGLFSSKQPDNIKFIKETDQTSKQEPDSILIDKIDDGPNYPNGSSCNSTNNISESIAIQLAKRIEARILKAFTTDTTRGLPAQITFLELFQATVVEAELLNKERTVKFIPRECQMDQGVSTNQIQDLVGSMFLCSLIYRKSFWWINLFSKEVIANKHGICYKGQHYIPTEDRDLFLLKKLAKEKFHVTVTIYSSQRNSKSLFWVHDKRMIQIRPVIQRRRFKALRHLIQTTNSNF